MRPPWYIYKDKNGDDGGAGDGGGGGSGGDGGDGNDKPGDGSGGNGKPGDGDGDKRGKSGLLAGAAAGAGDGGDDEAKKAADAAAAAASGDKKPIINLLSMDERPDWLPENYYDTENKGVHLQSLAKAERDMRSKLATAAKDKPKAPDKPDDYVFAFDGNTVKRQDGTVIMGAGGKPHEVPDNDPIVAAFARAAHAENLPQETFQRIADTVYRELITFTGENYELYDEATELERLGEGGKPLMEGIHTWLGGMQARGSISQAEFNEAMELGKYASGIRFLAKMRTLTGEQPIPITPDALEGADQYSDDALYALVGTELYQNDQGERDRVRKLFVARWGEQPGGASPKGLGVHTKPVTNKPVKSAR